MSQDSQFCTFFVDDLVFGVRVCDVQEVLRFQEMTCVPLAPEIVGGLINLRGQIVTAIDLRRRLGLPARSADESPMNVVVRTEDAAISLLVDEIGDVLEVSRDSFEPTPRTVGGTTRDLVLGVHKLKDKLLLILDIEKAVAVEAGANKSRDTH